MIYAFALTGPTAGGKTALSLSVARTLGCEIISCDSQQIYQGMDIGTAKATDAERALIPHHMIDVISPRDSFSAMTYRQMAMTYAADIQSRGKIPFFVGGTGLYLSSVLRGGDLSPDIPEGLREALEKRSPDENWDELLKIDPDAAALTHKNNGKRVIRALEIYKCTGVTKSEWDRRSKEIKPPYDATVLFLTCEDREKMYERIERRVDIMMAEGLLFEVRGLYEAGLLDPKYTSSGAIGYKEFLPVFKFGGGVDVAVAELKMATRHYAKRQLTWFNKKKNYHKIYVDKEQALKRAIEILGDFNG